MDIFQDFKNALSNLEMGWTNQWAFQDQRDKLLEQKNFALKNKKALLKEGYDVIDIYKQLDDFEKCCKRQRCLTDDPEEKIVLAAFEYAQQGTPIILSRINKDLFDLYSITKDTEGHKKANLSYKFDVYKNLIDFYLSYMSELKIDLFETIKDFLRFSEYLISLYPNDQANYYATGQAIKYLKQLIKDKDFEKANDIINSFELNPIGKSDITALEKIKVKLGGLK